MALRSMLHKNPKSHFYYFRKRVPQEYVESIGKKEIVFSLHTKDRKEADIRVVRAENEFNELIENARQCSIAPHAERMAALEKLQEFNLLPEKTDSYGKKKPLIFCKNSSRYYRVSFSAIFRRLCSNAGCYEP